MRIKWGADVRQSDFGAEIHASTAQFVDKQKLAREFCRIRLAHVDPADTLHRLRHASQLAVPSSSGRTQVAPENGSSTKFPDHSFLFDLY